MSVKRRLPVLLPSMDWAELAAPTEDASEELLTCILLKTNSRGGLLGRASSSGNELWRLHNTMCNACPEYFLPAPLESIPPGKVAFATSGASPALLDKGKRWGGVKPAWLHAGWTSLTFCCAFSLLTWIISMHSSLKWGKFNRSAYFLVFLPLSSANLPILMSFISWETITSLSPGLKFREGLGMFYQTLLVFNRSLWKS